MSKKHKQPKFGFESIMRIVVFAVIMYLAVGFLSNSKSNINISSLDPKVLGDFAPQVEQGQKWIEIEINKLKSQALDQAFERIKNSILK